MGKLSAIAFIITIMAPYRRSLIRKTMQMHVRRMRCGFAGTLSGCESHNPMPVQNKQQLSPACSNVFNRPPGASVDRERPVKAQRTKY